MYLISQVSKITGLTKKALRYYDEQDILKPSFRDEDNQVIEFIVNRLICEDCQARLESIELYLLITRKRKTFCWNINSKRELRNETNQF